VPSELSPSAARQVLPFDVDRDGLTDLVVSRQGLLSVAFDLLVARGDGSFENATPAPAPVNVTGPFNTFGTFFDDVDGDGALDLFAMVDEGESWFAWGVPNSDGPTFVPDPAISTRFESGDPMSIVPIDALHDGRVDYFVTKTIGSMRLYRGGDRQLADVSCSTSAIVGRGVDTWGAAAFDFNLDGWRDLLVLAEPDDHSHAVPSLVLLARGDGSFGQPAPSVFALDVLAQRLACGDVGGRGAVDCLAIDEFGNFTLIRDRLAPAGGWVGLRLRGTVSSPDAGGARVRLD